MTLEQAIQQLVEPAQRLERAVADAKAGYEDVLRQVMVIPGQMTTERRIAEERHTAAMGEIDKVSRKLDALFRALGKEVPVG